MSELILTALNTDAITTINSNSDKIETAVNAKAELNGNSTEKFEVADAVASTEAINKGQLDTAISAINEDISSLETELATKANTADVETALATKLDASDTTVTKQGNTFNGASQLVQLNSSGQLPALDGSLLTGLSLTVPTKTIYVATTGNDATGDGTSTSPYATITKALSTLNGKFLLGEVTIQVADGTYNHTSKISISHPQSSLISILGNSSTPANCVLNFSGCYGIDVLYGNTLYMNGFTINGNRTTNTTGIRLYKNCGATLANLVINNFYTNLSAQFCSAVYATSITINNGVYYNIFADVNSAMYFSSGTVIQGNSSNLTTYGVACGLNSSIYLPSASLSYCVLAVESSSSGFVYTIGSNYSNNTTNSSPAFNTFGNHAGYIAN